MHISQLITKNISFCTKIYYNALRHVKLPKNGHQMPNTARCGGVYPIYSLISQTSVCSKGEAPVFVLYTIEWNTNTSVSARFVLNKTDGRLLLVDGWKLSLYVAAVISVPPTIFARVTLRTWGIFNVHADNLTDGVFWFAAT